MVAGGQGCGCIHEGCSTKVEFLTLPSSLGNVAHELDKGLDGSVKWETLPDLHFPHAYTPAVAYVKEKLYVVGGGNFDLTMASDKVCFNCAIDSGFPFLYFISLCLRAYKRRPKAISCISYDCRAISSKEPESFLKHILVVILRRNVE